MATAVAATATLAVVLTPNVARAQGPCDPQQDGTTICTFNTPGTMVHFTTLPGFSSAHVRMEGGHGGKGEQRVAGGDAGSASGTLTGLDPVSGTPLELYVGQDGGDATDRPECVSSQGEDDPGDGGDWGGGSGASVTNSSLGCFSGGGGGGSFIMNDGEEPTSDIPRGAAAGGGGGGGSTTGTGGNGGNWTGDGTGAGTGGLGGNGGGPGTLQDPGNGGLGGPGGIFASTAGDMGKGGDGAGTDTDGNAGGGGGSGFFGGGGGGAGTIGAGGGGGSSCLPCPNTQTLSAKSHHSSHHSSRPSSHHSSRPSSHHSSPRKPEPVHGFHMAQAPIIQFTFGTPNPNTPGATAPPVPGAANPEQHHSGGHNNDPNTNTNPDVPTAGEVSRTATANCNPRVGVCTVRPPAGPDSQFSVTARNGNSRAVMFGTLEGGAKPDCPNYTELNSDWISFGFFNRQAGSTWHKTGMLTTRHKLSRAAALALSRKMQICFEAPYRFLTRDGYQLGGRNSVFDGVLPDCSAIAGRAEGGMARPCVQARQMLSRKGGWVVRFIFQVPANSRDPKALG